MVRQLSALLICAITICLAGCDADKVSRLEKQNQELQAQLQKQQAAADFDFQN